MSPRLDLVLYLGLLHYIRSLLNITVKGEDDIKNCFEGVLYCTG